MSTEAPELRNNPLDSVRCHFKSDIGQKREENQDSFGSAISNSFKFYFVCDGMGGVKGGAVASQLAVSVIEDACAERSTLDVEAIRAAVAEANARIFERGSSDEQLSGMGTTFVGLAFIKNRMLITSVGDSRAYRLRDGEISQLTEDHTLVMELLRSGSITEEQAVNHPVSHMLTRSLGPAPEIEIDCWESPEPPAPGDKYLLCSDGLYNMLGTEELGEVILSLPPEEAVEELISLANLRGGHDNITVMLVSVDDTYPVQEAPPVEKHRASADSIDRLSVDDESVGDDNLLNDESQEDSQINGELDEYAVEPEPAEQDSSFTLKKDGSLPGDRPKDQILSPKIKIERNAAANSARENASKSSNAEANTAKVARNESTKSSAKPARPEQVRAENGGIKEPPIPAILSHPRAQAKFVVLLIGALAGAYLLGHLHGATDEDTAILARQVDHQTYESTAEQAPEITERQPIAVAPVAIQPRVEAATDVSQEEQSAKIEAVGGGSQQISEPQTDRAVSENHGETTSTLDRQSDDRRAELQRAVADLEQKLAAFRTPISGKAGEMLKVSTAQIERISKDLDTTRTQIDSATRALTIWLGRKKRLQTGDPINLATEVSISSDAVREKQDAFNRVTYAFLQENEVLRFNPGDKARERRVADLARQRLAAMRELIEAVKSAIQEELSKVEKQIESSTLARVDLEGQLEQARRDVEYVKALAGSDSRAREAKQLELQRLLDVARAELDELSRSGR